jgi:hypothetical protein
MWSCAFAQYERFFALISLLQLLNPSASTATSYRLILFVGHLTTSGTSSPLPSVGGSDIGDRAFTMPLKGEGEGEGETKGSRSKGERKRACGRLTMRRRGGRGREED